MNATPDENAPLSLNFEEALKELETIVRKLEEGKISLEEAIVAYERGAALKSHCERLLKEARLKIDQIMVGENGEVSAQPLDI